jgi:SAM-dependent methyltransferase
VVSDYAKYVQQEWDAFAQEPSRHAAAVKAASGLQIHQVLEIGCGGGQELIPFGSLGATCFGIDISKESGSLGQHLFARHYPKMPVWFATAQAEHLPFRSNAFDIVICRVAIPYTDNRTAISEIARVLQHGGVLLLKVHHLRYYINKAIAGIKRRSPRFSIHALRVLLSGTLYHLTGWQPSGGLLVRECFQTEWLLRKELARLGLRIERELDDSNPLTPSYRILKIG